MTKNIIFIFAVLCSLQAQANVQPSDRDTVHSVPLYNKTELLQPIQPVYLDGVVMPIFRSGNWFVSMAGGATAFLGTPLGCEDLFGRLKPSYSFAVGKWFSPTVGARINYNGLQFKDGTLSTQEYHYVHADLLWNVLGRSYTRQEQVRWTLAPFAGVGLVHNADNGHNPFAILWRARTVSYLQAGQCSCGTLRHDYISRLRRIWQTQPLRRSHAVAYSRIFFQYRKGRMETGYRRKPLYPS